MSFDFDRVIDRRGTHCAKWDNLEARFGVDPDDALPMWVADMDFAAPPAVTAALQEIVDRGVYGYFGDPSDYHQAIQGWMARRHGWEIDTDWILTSAGGSGALGIAVQAFCRPGDGVIIQEPVYYPFPIGIHNNGCHVVPNPLVLEDGVYRMDLDALAERVDEKTRMMFLCSPHNPTGRVWSADELRAVAEFCRERDIILLSDEVHQDIVFDKRHTVTATLGADVADNVVTLISPSKTFNLAGGRNGGVIIPNPKLREKMRRQLERNGLANSNMFGYAMIEAAYRTGDDWLDALLVYLRANRDYVAARVAQDMPGVRAMDLDATYLAWLDLNGLGMTDAEIIDRFQSNARVFCDPGMKFGVGGSGFMRLNFACPRATLEQAMDRLADAFSDLQ